jgi:putative Ca2+/H+ antiporter (TMEM165/GDT1 family)
MAWLEPLLVSTGVVAISEIGDKTQLLAFMLAARFRRPLPVILGILAATIVNHLLASLLGVAVSTWITPEILRWVLAVGFLGMAAWVLIPDKADDAAANERPGMGPFLTTALLFFLLEMGDKTQIATVALSAKYQSVLVVTCGTTLGMLLADVPAVFIGDRLAHRIPLRAVHIVAALIFATLAVLAACRVGF